MNFNGIYNRTDKKDRWHDKINNLDIENVVYTGDQEIVTQLKKAIQEQFKFQRNINKNKEKIQQNSK